MTPRRSIAGMLPACLLLAVPATDNAAAWTPKTQIVIAENAASIAPPDLARQIERHRKDYRRGLLAAFEQPVDAHRKYQDGSGALDRSIESAVASAISAIRRHHAFPDIVFHLGVVAHFVADASDPLAASNEDPAASAYSIDYLEYIESAMPRYPIVFYGNGRDVTDQSDLRRLIAGSLGRGRSFCPLIGREYERIGSIDGTRLFDDRSTAFGIGSVALSHAVSDVAAVLRYIWLEAGGGDRRQLKVTRPEPHGDSTATSRGLTQP